MAKKNPCFRDLKYKTNITTKLDIQELREMEKRITIKRTARRIASSVFSRADSVLRNMPAATAPLNKISAKGVAFARVSGAAMPLAGTGW